MNKQQQLFQIRTRKLGLLMADALNANRRTVEETAAAIGVSIDEYQAFEKGTKSPFSTCTGKFCFLSQCTHRSLLVEHFTERDS